MKGQRIMLLVITTGAAITGDALVRKNNYTVFSVHQCMCLNNLCIRIEASRQVRIDQAVSLGGPQGQ